MLRLPHRLALFLTALLTTTSTSTTTALARPVSYRGGKMLMSESRGDQASLAIAYTPAPEWAVGLQFRRTQLGDGRGAPNDLSLPLTWLVARANLDLAQANAYLSVGPSLLQIAHAPQAALTAALEADYETRSIYFSGRTEWLGAVSTLPDGGVAYSRLRGGFAPYLAGYEGLQAWAILQLEHRSYGPAFPHDIDVMPMMRLLYQNILIELGASLTGRLELNWTTEW